MTATEARATSEQESRQVAEEARETEWAGRELPPRAVPRQLPARPHPSLPARRASERPEFTRRSTTSSRRSSASKVDPVAIDETGEYPRAGRRRAPQARRLRHEDPEGVRRPRLHRDASTCTVMQLVGSYDGNIARAALRAPVDRRAAAAQALRHAGAEEEVPAALRRGRDLGVRAHRAARRLRSRRASRRPPSCDGDDFVLNGEKLWCTNGTLAELLVVMARDPEDEEDQRLHRRDRLAGREGRAPLPLHGPARRSPTA